MADEERTTSPGMPPTLGDRLDDVMWSRRDSSADVAARVGASAIEVGRWAGDRAVPTGDQLIAVARYLDVDVAEVRRLVLRTQMRMVHRGIRRDRGPVRRP